MSLCSSRAKPNLLIVGTPGVGKSTFAKLLQQRLAEVDGEDAYQLIEVGALIKQDHLYSEWDDERDCSIFDADKVHDALEEKVTERGSAGGVIIDFHSCDVVEGEWFDGIILLRASTEVLFDRLTARGYNSAKVTENVECEIFDVIRGDLAEFCEAECECEWKPPSVDGMMQLEVLSESAEQLEENVSHVVEWCVRNIKA